jgi:hypothetical protein
MASAARSASRARRRCQRQQTVCAPLGVSAPLVVYCGVQVGAVGVPVRTTLGLKKPFGAQMCSPLARVAMRDPASQALLSPMATRTFAQLAPDGWVHEQGLQAKLPVSPVYHSVRVVPEGQTALPGAIAQRGGLLVMAGRQAEPVPQPPPRIVAAQKRLVVVQVGVLAMAVPPAVQPA